ncbi:hypothetical protein DNTS_003503 [Danionella cerebrum]|uniref:NAD(P)-binding domain-containing protein n=1 Tax=Danionella cerebrum TaxID=2873325 RepID=A0A553MLH1_9TELE|nr:hypothetical protein DNTS_003503 [Danionella translucida]
MNCIERQTVLVTGGAGFIGSHLVCSLALRFPHWRIINVDKLQYCSSLKNLSSVEDSSSYTFLQGDVCDALFIDGLFRREKIHVVFHCAAETHVALHFNSLGFFLSQLFLMHLSAERSFSTPLHFMQVNVEGTRVLVRAALQAGVQRFIYISTDEVYGESLQQAFHESCPKRPTNPYSRSKAAAESVVMSFWRKHQFPALITRSSNVYGPRQHHEKVWEHQLPAASPLELRASVTIQGSGLQSRHFLFVSDVVEGFLTVLQKGIVGQVYNIGSSFEIPILQLAQDLVPMVLGSSPEAPDDWVEFVEDRPVLELRYPLDSGKLQSLGWRPRVSWSEGIRRTGKAEHDHTVVRGEPSLLAIEQRELAGAPGIHSLSVNRGMLQICWIKLQQKNVWSKILIFRTGALL